MLLSQIPKDGEAQLLGVVPIRAVGSTYTCLDDLKEYLCRISACHKVRCVIAVILGKVLSCSYASKWQDHICSGVGKYRGC